MKPTSHTGHFSFLISDGGKGMSFVPRQRGEMPWDKIVTKHITLIQKRHF